MKFSTGERAAYRAVATTAGVRIVVFVMSGVFTLLTTRLVIQDIGVVSYGLVVLVSSLWSLLPFADLGVGAAVTNTFAERGPHDESSARVLISSARVLLVSGGVITGAALLVSVVDAWPLLLGGSIRRIPELRWATAGVFAVFAVGLPVSLGQRVLLGIGRPALLVALQGAVAPLWLALAALVIVCHGGSAWLALCPAAATLGAGIVTAAVAARLARLPLGALAVAALRPRQFPGTSVRRTAGPMLVVLVALPIALQTDRLMLNHRSSLHELAVYSVVAQVFAPLLGVVNSAGQTLWPVFARARVGGAGDGPSVRKTVAAFTVAGVGAAAAFVVLGGPLSVVFADGRVNPTLPVLLGFAAFLVAQSGHLPSGMYLTSPAGLRFQAGCVLVMLPLNLALSWWLAPRWGAAGPIAASAFTVAVCQWLPGFLRATRTDDVVREQQTMQEQSPATGARQPLYVPVARHAAAPPARADRAWRGTLWGRRWRELQRSRSLAGEGGVVVPQLADAAVEPDAELPSGVTGLG